MSIVAIVRTTYMTSSQFRDVVNGKAMDIQEWTHMDTQCGDCSLPVLTSADSSLKTRLKFLFRTYMD